MQRQGEKCTKGMFLNLFLITEDVPSAKYAANCVLASFVFAHNNIPERFVNRNKQGIVKHFKDKIEVHFQHI